MARPCAFLALNAATVLCLAAPAPAQTPDPGPAADLLSATRQARDAKDFERAERLARQGVARFQDPVWPLTLAHILADQGKATEALAILKAPWPGGLPRLDRLLAEGYASQRGGDVWRALTTYGEALILQPENAEAKEAVAGILTGLRAAHGAEAVAGPNAQREADRAAALVRWSNTLPTADPATRFDETDAALALLDSLIAKARATEPVDEALIRRLRIDRLPALRNRFRMAEVLSEVQALTADGTPLPDYAQNALGDALLHERRPQEALAAYELAAPIFPRARYGRVFALVESERLEEAVAAADALVAAQPPFQAYLDGPATAPNRERAYADLLAAQVRLWTNDLDGGYARLEALSRDAPANFLFRRALVSAMRARGWPRRAEEEAAIAATFDPNSLPTAIMRVETDFSRNRLSRAQAGVDRLTAIAPYDDSIRRLSTEVAATRGWSIEGDLGPTRNEGGGDNAAGDEWTSWLRVQSPPLTGGLRLMALTDSSIADPVEGRASRHRAGAGLAFQGADLAASLYATSSSGTVSRAGAGATLDWQASDRLSFGLAGERFSSQTPLRALLYGITTDTVSAAARWRWDETASVAAATERAVFSDGNDRVSLSLVGERNLALGPHLDLTGRLGVWYAHNSLQSGPYFSPDEVVSSTLALTLRQIGWRRYQRAFTHALGVELGFSDQNGFTKDWIGSLSYEHRWRADPWWELYYAATLDRRVYDGDPERGLGVRFGFRRRL